MALVTGHTRADGSDDSTLDWPALAAFPGTLVFYMGVRQLRQIAESLIAAGRRASEPVAIVERGTLPDQRTVTGTLAEHRRGRAGRRCERPRSPWSAPLPGSAEELEWWEGGIRYPLAGRTVAVTRARAQASGLARRLEDLGASVVQAPVIRIQPLPVPPLDLTPYDLVCLTSPNAVDALFERLPQAAHHPRDARAFAGTPRSGDRPRHRACAGRARHRSRTSCPSASSRRRSVEALADIPVKRALVARAKQARDVIPEALRARGAQVDVLALYETVAEPLSPDALEAAREADYITFTSSSTVRFFLDAAGSSAGLSPATRIVSIGPVTSETLREHGLQPHVEAEDHDVDGVVQALLADVTAKKG